MVVLSRVEFPCWDNFGDNLALEWLVLLQLRPGSLGELFLLLVMVEDSCAVLTPVVAELPILLRRVNVMPEHVEEPLVAHLF
jgi:hypothetical protein